MPVFFYIDPEVVEDHGCRKISDLTLSYTFFMVDDDDAAEIPEGESGVKTHGSLPAGQLPPGQLPPGMSAAAAQALAAGGAVAAAAMTAATV
jgi:hypothetical protein